MLKKLWARILFSSPGLIHPHEKNLPWELQGEELCGVWTRKISQSNDPIIPKLLDCFHLNQWQFSLELPVL